MDVGVSVLVPIYNSSQYIERCARSLFEQTQLDAIEFIFVNDGSTDDSVEVLLWVVEQYPKRKRQFVLVDRKQNMGVAYTRREAVHLAKGNYICWCDSDDWVAPDTYEKMYAQTLDGFYDVVICNYIEEYADHQNYWRYREYQTPQQAMANFYWPGFSFSLWSKMTKRLLMTQAIDFIYPTNYGEDSYASIYLFIKASSVKFMKDAFYHYDCTNNASIMHSAPRSKELWKQQKANIDKLSSLCSGTHRFRGFFLTYKREMKREFRKSFPNIWQYFWTYRECAMEFEQYHDYRGLRKLYVWMVNNFFPLYWLYNRGTWNK